MCVCRFVFWVSVRLCVTESEEKESVCVLQNARRTKRGKKQILFSHLTLCSPKAFIKKTLYMSVPTYDMRGGCFVPAASFPITEWCHPHWPQRYPWQHSQFRHQDALIKSSNYSNFKHVAVDLSNSQPLTHFLWLM